MSLRRFAWRILIWSNPIDPDLAQLPLRDVPLAFVDVETSGISWDYGHRVIEVGAVRVEGGRVTAEYQQLIDPGRSISPGVTALTGITSLMVAGQPGFAGQVGRLNEVVGGAVVAGHNIGFDLSFLRGEYALAGRDIAREWAGGLGTCVGIGSGQVIDTVRIARRRFGRGGNGLQRLSQTLGIMPSTAHRALADAQTTLALFGRLMEPLGGWSATLAQAIQQQGGPVNLAQTRDSSSGPLLPLELAEALEQRRVVQMEYVDARQRRTRRTIYPLEVRRANGELTLIAHCHLRDDRRAFKVERIVEFLPVVDEQVSAHASVGQALGD
jgi:DNA polymerase III epsilon subunit family exonuclease